MPCEKLIRVFFNFYGCQKTYGNEKNLTGLKAELNRSNINAAKKALGAQPRN